MKYLLFLVLLGAFGTGCANLPSVNIPKIPKIDVETLGWKTYQNTTYGFSISTPSPGYTPGIPEYPDDVDVISLGSAVQAPSSVSVPETALHVKVVKNDTPLLKGGCYAEQGWENAREANTKTVSAAGRSFCLLAAQGAAAGNRYSTYAYATPVGDHTVILSFVVHSLVCENFERPTEQCRAFDETRDTAIFPKILETFSTSTVTP